MRKLLLGMACAFACSIANAQESRDVQQEFTITTTLTFQIKN